MAVLFSQQPGLVNFSNNPIILKARTTLSGKIFLRIVCDIHFYTSNNTETYNETLSSPVEDKGTVTFNLSNASKVLYNKVIGKDFDGFPVVCFTLSCYEKWVEDGIEMTGDPTNISSEMIVVPGGLTDYERLSMSNYDIEALMGDAKMLSRKPTTGGVVYQDETLLLPYFSKTVAEQDSYNIKYGTEEAHTVSYIRAPKAIGVIKIGIDKAHVGQSVSIEYKGKTITFMIYPINKKVKQLRFVNSFGVVENISVCVNDELEYEIKSKESTLTGEVSFENVIHRMTRKTKDSGNYKLSSGYVDSNWAEWFTHDFLMTPKAWMLIGKIWVPGSVVPDDSVQMYDHAKIGLQKVDFTFNMSIEGGFLNSYVN